MTDRQTHGQTQGEKQYVSRPLQGGDIKTKYVSSSASTECEKIITNVILMIFCLMDDYYKIHGILCSLNFTTYHKISKLLTSSC